MKYDSFSTDAAGDKQAGSHRLIISLTDKEYTLLKNIYELNGRPMAKTFIEAARDLHLFGFLNQIYRAALKVVKVRDKYKSIISDSLFKKESPSK